MLRIFHRAPADESEICPSSTLGLPKTPSPRHVPCHRFAGWAYLRAERVRPGRIACCLQRWRGDEPIAHGCDGRAAAISVGAAARFRCNSRGGFGKRSGRLESPRHPPLREVSYAVAVAADDPLVFYLMDETSGTSFADSSGNNRSARFVGAVRLGRPAILPSERAYGSASFADGYALEALTWTRRAVTAECWIRPSAGDVAADADPRLVGNGWTDHDGKGFMLWLRGGHAGFTTGWTSAIGPSVLRAGSVYHLVGTFDANSPDIDLYVDGVLVAHSTYENVPNPQLGDSTNVHLGVLDALSIFGFVDHFQGDMSDCAVYDHALSAAQTRYHYDVGNASNPTPPSRSPTPGPFGTPIAYNATTACINHVQYANTVLPQGKGEFSSNGLDRSYWGGVKTRTVGVNAGTWGPGFLTSWGSSPVRHVFRRQVRRNRLRSVRDCRRHRRERFAAGSPDRSDAGTRAHRDIVGGHGQRSVAGDECGLKLRRTKRRRLARAQREQPQRRPDRLESRDGVSRRRRHVRRHADLGRRDS